jgi:hypothetical protein
MYNDTQQILFLLGILIGVILAYIVVLIGFGKKISLKQKVERLDKEIKEAEIELMEYGNELEASRPRAFVDVDNYLEKNKHLLENTIPAVYYKKPIKKRIHRQSYFDKRPHRKQKKQVWNKGKHLSKKYKNNISKGMKKMWRKRKKR